MKSILLITIIFIITLSTSTAQTVSNLTGKRIYINPGHGGNDGNDRFMEATGFWESEGNLTKGLAIKKLLDNLNATTAISRTTNTTADDRALSSIAEESNAFNADMFLSIHSNGFNGLDNYVLMLYNGTDETPTYANSKPFGKILFKQVLANGQNWTSSTERVRGDRSFYNYAYGLGVLYPLTSPGVLSEGSFHDYIPESWRLKNPDFLTHEAWAFQRSFSEWFNMTPLNIGIVAGVIRNPNISPSYFFKTGTNDQYVPINKGTITLMPGNKVYKTDTLNNGFFMFDSLVPGVYKLYFSNIPGFYPDSAEVTVQANKSVLINKLMQLDTTAVPEIISLVPSNTDSIPLNQEFTLTFNIPMNPDSVQKAIKTTPSVELTFTWLEMNRVVKFKPKTQWAFNTNYTINITNVACSKWKVPVNITLSRNYVTKNHVKLQIINKYPLSTQQNMSVYPQICIKFNAPLNINSAKENIRLFDYYGNTINKAFEEFYTIGGQGEYRFEPAIPLEYNKTYKIKLNAGLLDEYNLKLGTDNIILFTTRTTPYYPTGTILANFDNISKFWDPNGSGSTVGTDPEATTITLDNVRKKAGTGSGKLTYQFTGTNGGVCREYYTEKPLVGTNPENKVGIWIFGDLSNNDLEAWFYTQNTTTNHIVPMGKINWAGWELKTINIADIPGGNLDKEFHSFVVRQSNTGSQSGNIYFDDLQIISNEATSVKQISDNTISELNIYPNPVSGYATISYTLKSTCYIKIAIYNTSGQKMFDIYNGIQIADNYKLNWQNNGTIPPGLYILKTELFEKHNSGNKQVQHTKFVVSE